MSKVRYGLQLMGKVRTSNLDTLNQEMKDIQKAQNKLARLLNGTRISDKIRSSVLLQRIKMSSINQIMAEIKLLEIWKSLNVDGNPLNLPVEKKGENSMNTRSSGQVRIVETINSYKSGGTFINDAIKIWNRAPQNIKDCNSLFAAKKAIKVYSRTLPF